MVIKLVNAARYYKGLPHQVKAFEYLQSKLTNAELAEFAGIYRRADRQSKANSFVAKILNRLKELNIDLYNGGYHGWGYTIIGVEGVELDLTPHADQIDKWNDIVFGIKAYKDSNKFEIVGPFKCTTEPGRYYTANPLNRRGAAYVKTDVKHNAVWQLGWHKDQRDCLVQTGAAITVIRDGNRDGKRGANEYEDTGWFGRMNAEFAA